MKNQEFKKGAWSREEDSLLRRCIEIHGEGRWHLVSKRAGLNRCRKSCRLRWVNYLDPNVNREKFEEDEIDLIIRMHRLLGNKWSLIAGRIPGRTANDIKNYFNTHLRKMLVSQPKEEEEPERHRVVRPIPRYATTVIGTGGPTVVSENQHHQLHHKPPPQLPLPEQNEDPVIENNEHTTWWNDTFKFLELEGVDKMNENPDVPNVGESSTNAGTGME